MSTAFIIYNKKAGTDDSFESIKSIENSITDEVKYIDVARITDYRVFFLTLEPDDYVILAGGDGTLNRFANNIQNIEIKNKILYFPNGTGNDFAKDFEKTEKCEPFEITQYLQNLPTVTVKNKKYRFVNGIGYGIDGYCCEVGDLIKENSTKKVNYTAIAIKGLLFHYEPTCATVTVDGVTHTYKNVWLAPTMNGRFYGGGMMPTPDQKRNGGELSVMVFHNKSKLKTLMIFPTIFKGKHVKHTKYVDVLRGKNVSVEFDRPVALQIDGETILDVSSYTATGELSEKVVK